MNNKTKMTDSQFSNIYVTLVMHKEELTSEDVPLRNITPPVRARVLVDDETTPPN